MQEMRLQKAISDGGITSRRKAEQMILQGRVKVNGEIVRELGTKVCPHEDIIQVDGHTVDPFFVEKIYVLFHKPRGCVTTLSDPEGRPTVMDHLKSISQRIYPIGRLDYLSEGLLLLTNDGEMANKVMHPSNEVVKVYEVKVFGRVTDVILKNLRKGALVEGEFLKPASVRIVKILPNKTWLEFRLKEGKNREIRRLCEYCELTIDKLKRVAIGSLTVDGVAPGNFQFLTKNEILAAFKAPKIQENEMSAYVSPKKSIKLKKERSRVTITLADDPKFKKYRKENYSKTMKLYETQHKQHEEAQKLRAIEGQRKYIPLKNGPKKMTPTMAPLQDGLKKVIPLKKSLTKTIPLKRSVTSGLPLRGGAKKETPFRESRKNAIPLKKNRSR